MLGRTTILSNSVLRAVTAIFAMRGILAAFPAVPKAVSMSISHVGSRSKANHTLAEGGAGMHTTARPCRRVTRAVTMMGTLRLCPITSIAISIDTVSVKPPWYTRSPVTTTSPEVLMWSKCALVTIGKFGPNETLHIYTVFRTEGFFTFNSFLLNLRVR
jgi:hypothetical protein